jgi:hypothetical protein
MKPWFGLVATFPRILEMQTILDHDVSEVGSDPAVREGPCRHS